MKLCNQNILLDYSTVTVFARFWGLSGSNPNLTADKNDNFCNGKTAKIGKRYGLSLSIKKLYLESLKRMQ